MIFRYDRKGLIDAPEVFIFQDLLDSPRRIREMGKILEPHFHVFYFYLPESIHWLKPSAVQELKNIAIEEIYPILEESEEKKIAILGGFSFSFWKHIFVLSEEKFTKAYILNPELDLLGSVGTFLEVLKTYWDKRGFYLFDWLQTQPIAHHISLLQSAVTPGLRLPLHFLRTSQNLSKFQYETKKLIEKYPNSEWSNFPYKTDESLKFSPLLKKFLLMNISQDHGMKLDTVWSDVLKN